MGEGARERERQKQTNLEDVVSRFNVGDIDPLAVDVVSVRVPAAHSDALLPEVGTFIPLVNP